MKKLIVLISSFLILLNGCTALSTTMRENEVCSERDFAIALGFTDGVSSMTYVLRNMFGLPSDLMEGVKQRAWQESEFDLSQDCLNKAVDEINKMIEENRGYSPEESNRHNEELELKLNKNNNL